jgi:hypothetical protein
MTHRRQNQATALCLKILWKSIAPSVRVVLSLLKSVHPSLDLLQANPVHDRVMLAQE